MNSTDSALHDAKMSTLNQIGEYRLIPVLGECRAQYADLLVTALHTANLPLIEITQREPEALELLQMMAAETDLIVGAGTIINVAQAKACFEAGAQFLVSPGVSPDIMRFGREKNLTVIPGIATASDILRALECGVSTLKFFPAGFLGGPAGLRAMSSVFPDVSFIPTGGVTMANLNDYLAIQSVLAVGGTWMFPSELLRSGDTQSISELLAAARAQAARLFS